MAGSKNNNMGVRSSGTTINKNSKKSKHASKKTLGFDLNDMESRLAFWSFIVVGLLLVALLIAGFALGFSRCGGAAAEPEERPAAEEQAAEQKLYADVGDVIALFDSVSSADAAEYNYNNGIIRFTYDPEKVNLYDRFDEASTVTVARENGKSTGLTVTYSGGREGTDPSAYLIKYAELMEAYGQISDVEQSFSEENGVKTAESRMSLAMSDYTLRVITKMQVRGDDAVITQLTLGADQTAEEMKALIECYHSAGFAE